MRCTDFRHQVTLKQRISHARTQILPVCLVVGVLELAPATFGKMSAWRILVMRTWRQCAVLKQDIAWHAKHDMAAA